MGHIHHNHGNEMAAIAASNDPLLRRVTMVAIATSIILVILKTGGWSYTNASSMLSSLADSLFDVLMSAINFFAVRYAIKPADDDHRHGHTSIEDIAGLTQFAFICGSMLFVMAHSIQQFFQHDKIITEPEYGIGIMLVSLAMTSGLVLYQRWVYKKTGSLIIKADSLHYLSDILMNLSVIGSLFVAKIWHIQWLDPLLAIVIAIYVIKEAWEIGQRSFNNLMDREMPDDKKEKIKQIINESPNILEFHDLKTRQSGNKIFIQMHVGLSKNLTFQQAHDAADALEKKLLAAFPGADVIIHQDPV